MMQDPFRRLSVIELPVIKPHSCTQEIFMCQFRDGLGYLHKCNHPETGFLQCEAAIHFNGCPRGFKTEDTRIKGTKVSEV